MPSLLSKGDGALAFDSFFVPFSFFFVFFFFDFFLVLYELGSDLSWTTLLPLFI
jgi:hypothetical protein